MPSHGLLCSSSTFLGRRVPFARVPPGFFQLSLVPAKNNGILVQKKRCRHFCKEVNGSARFHVGNCFALMLFFAAAVFFS